MFLLTLSRPGFFDLLGPRRKEGGRGVEKPIYVTLKPLMLRPPNLHMILTKLSKIDAGVKVIFFVHFVPMVTACDIIYYL